MNKKFSQKLLFIFATIIIFTLLSSSLLIHQMTRYGFMAAQRVFIQNFGTIAVEKNNKVSVNQNSKIEAFEDWDSVPPAIQAISHFKPPQTPFHLVVNDAEDYKIGALMMYPKPNGGSQYVWFSLDPLLSDNPMPTVNKIVITLSIIALILILSLAWYLHSQLMSPIVQVSNCVRQFDWQGTEALKLPKQKYQEFQFIVDALESSVERIQKSQQAEMEFLRFSSHELRTPIAISQNAFELEHAKGNILSPAMQRAEQATAQMKAISETLLWLANKDIELPSAEPIELQKLIKDIAHEQQKLYLTHQISTLVIEGDDTSLSVLYAPLSIILTNLIRNSLQHGSQRINIYQQGSIISITNPLDSSANSGFGLGLKLVESLAKRLDWQFEAHHRDNQFCATLTIKQLDKRQNS